MIFLIIAFNRLVLISPLNLIMASINNCTVSLARFSLESLYLISISVDAGSSPGLLFAGTLRATF